MDADDLLGKPKEEPEEVLTHNGRPYLVGEKGFGTCEECGRKTMGRTNTRCSRCGGTPVHLLVGTPAPETVLGVWEPEKGARIVRRGYRAASCTQGGIIGKVGK
jgi:hypothetical protein